MNKAVGTVSCALGVLSGSVAVVGCEVQSLAWRHVLALIALAIMLNSVGVMVAVSSVLSAGPVKTAFDLGVQAGRTCWGGHGDVAQQALRSVADEAA
jgi:hypothetical protein